jgi:hypothetical protein
MGSVEQGYDTRRWHGSRTDVTALPLVLEIKVGPSASRHP